MRRSAARAAGGEARPASAALPLACLLPLLLPACAAAPGQDPALMLREALATTRASLAAAGAASAALPAGAGAGVVQRAGPPAAARPPGPIPAAAAAAAPADGPRRRGAAPPRAAAALLGLPAEAVRGMLGDPSLRRPEGVAEIWLYEAPSCRLDVVLYAEGRALVVAHAAARALAAEEAVTEAACLAAIAAAPAPLPWTRAGRRA